jgi:hypothetical protein
MVCQDIKCPDYLTDDGDLAWCYRASMPAQVAATKCPKVAAEETGDAIKTKTDYEEG